MVARTAQRYLSGGIPVRFRLVRYCEWNLEAVAYQHWCPGTAPG